ncbi:MAG: hypothetical protein EOO27_21395, partial [Comamonadaceae bacterium]
MSAKDCGSDEAPWKLVDLQLPAADYFHTVDDDSVERRRRSGHVGKAVMSAKVRAVRDGVVRENNDAPASAPSRMRPLRDIPRCVAEQDAHAEGAVAEVLLEQRENLDYFLRARLGLPSQQ